MKKGVFKFLVLVVLIVSCSDDDEVIVPPTEDPVEEPTDVVGSVVLNEVAYLNNQVEIFNNSDATVDLDGYFLCLGPGTYRQIGALETTGNVQLGAGEFLVVDYDMPNEVGGLGLYINNTGFGDAANIADFVQWGDGGTTRESVAVEAGLWTAGEFVAVLNDPDNSIIYDGEGMGADNWAETTSVTFGAENVLTEPVVESVGSVVLNEVAYLNNQVEIYNNSDATVDLDGYFLCMGPGTYRQIGALETTGNVQLGAGEFLVVDYDMPNEVGGLGLYINNTGFGDAANIADFVQWGDGGTTRESVAVEAGLWTAGEFVAVLNDPDNTIIYDGEGMGADNWAETTSVTFGAENVLTEPVVESVGSVVLNEVAYLNNQVEIYNNSDATVDLDGYFLCMGPGTYRQIGALETTGNVQLGAGEFLVVDYDMPNEVGGLGLYINNTGFGDAANIADFVQWGDGGTTRESVAVEAGLWTAGEFVAVLNDPDNTIIYDGEGMGADNWAETTSVTFGAENVLTEPVEEPTDAVGSVVLNEVAYLNNQVEIYNNSDATVDLDGYWLCLAPGTYRRIGALETTGNVQLGAGEFLVVDYDMPNEVGGLGLYINNTGFGDAANIADFVQWGGSGTSRENVAVAAGIWTAGDFVTVTNNPDNSIIYDGEGNASSDWSEEVDPSLGQPNE